MSSKKTIQQRQAGVRVLILLAVLICINMLAARFHQGLDLTQERRFTLSQPTKKLLRKMDGVAVVEVLLEGKNLPAGFQRLKESIRERLQSFRDVSGGKVVFKFRDPFEGKNDQEKGEVFNTLGQKGINGMNIRQNGDEKYSEQIVFPYAIVTYKGKEVPVRLLENHLGLSPLAILNYSESLLEYKFGAAINQLSRPDKPLIACLAGNGEMISYTSYDALTTLQGLYRLDTLDLNSGTHIPAAYEAIMIIKPTIPFDDKAKFKLDQYVMNGGHLIMLVDGVNASMDSLRSEQYIATANDLNLDDILFKWGVRVNSDLIEDLSCNRIPIITGTVGDQVHSENHGWFYLPVFTPTSHHPIVNNMDAIMSLYASSIDTIANPEIHKTILLESSQYSRTTMAPARISLSMLRYAPRPELYNKPYRPAAVLLEGKFQSAFQDKLAPDFVRVLRDSLHQPFKPQADSAGSMIIISDGDLFINGFTRKEGPMEMGYWDVDQARYANKTFMLNCVEYLTDHSGLLEARNKDVRLRLLDAGRIKVESNKWKTINIVIPLALVLIFASAYIFFRRRRYEKS